MTPPHFVHKVVGMVADMGGRQKKLLLADMLLHMGADKVAGMVADMGADKKKYWRSWWPTKK